MTARNKIGLHLGNQPSAFGYGDYVRALDKARIPAVCMSVGGEGLGDIVAVWDSGSTVQHVAVVRYMPDTPPGSPPVQDVPRYELTEEQAAVHWWSWYKPKIGAEVIRHKNKIVLKAGNELDKQHSEWLAGFNIILYDIMQNDPDGPFRLGAFGFAAGEPEPEHWRGPVMLEYLRLCAADPVGAAVVLHEYSYTSTLQSGYPFKIGRFQDLFLACAENGIARPWVYVHEFGWEQGTVPGEEEAMSQLPWAAALYAKYKEVRGAGLWSLQSTGGYSDPVTGKHISQQVQPLIEPIKQYSLTAQFPDEDEDMTPKDCDLFLDLGRFVHLLPQDTTGDEIAKIAKEFNAAKNSFVFSHDDAELIVSHGRGENAEGKKVSEVRIWNPERFPDDVVDYFDSRGHKYSIGYFEGEPTAQVSLRYRPCQTTVITQLFGANPDSYDDLGLPGHDGMDYGVGKDGAFYAAAGGVVVHASDRKWSSNTASAYGWHVVLLHGDYCTVYAHARPDLPVTVGQSVVAGQVVGYSGNTGNSTGYHLHFGLLDKSGTIDPGNGYPLWTFGRPVNPAQFVTNKPAPPLPKPAIDTLSYFEPTGQYGHKLAIRVGEGTQPMQLEKRADDVILRKGDGIWFDSIRFQDIEQWRVRDGEIQKGIDTSDAGNGGRDGYDLGWAKWIPRFVQVGETYHSTPIVRRFDRTNNCETISEIVANDYLHIKALVPTWVSPANSNIVLNNVLVIEWRNGTPDLTVPPNETYYFCEEYGYVGWNNNFIVEVTEGQQPLSGALDCGV